MQRLTLAERVEHFKRVFWKIPACWPWLVEEDGEPVFYAVWTGGGDYSNETPYHGAYPRGYLKRLLAFFPDILPEHVLHACAGSVPKGRGLRLDLNPATEPDILGSVYDVKGLVGDRRFRLTTIDPPYTAKDAAKYGTPPLNRARAVRAIADVTAPRGFLAWLDTRAPIYRKDQWRIVGRIYHDRSTNHAIRRTAIFERVGVVVRKAAPGELACANGYPSVGAKAPGWTGPHHCPGCAVDVERSCREFEAAVARGEYDAEGYTPAERRALARRSA